MSGCSVRRRKRWHERPRHARKPPKCPGSNAEFGSPKRRGDGCRRAFWESGRGLAILPRVGSCSIAHDKAALMSLAEEKGISVPKTVVALHSPWQAGIVRAYIKTFIPS